MEVLLCLVPCPDRPDSGGLIHSIVHKSGMLAFFHLYHLFTNPFASTLPLLPFQSFLL